MGRLGILIIIGVLAAVAAVFAVPPLLRGSAAQRVLAGLFLAPSVVYLFLLIRMLVIADAPASGESFSRIGPMPRQLQELTFTTEAYRREVLRMLIEEVNSVARAMGLPEELPITEEDVLGAYISPPRMAQGLKALGNITTRHYTYFVSVDMKFSYLVKTGLEQDYPLLRAEYLWPMDRMDTNAAYQMATQFLAAASMDVSALNRDYGVEIRAFTPEGRNGRRFVPVYWVMWKEGRDSVVSVELFEPTRSLRQLHVEESRYILRDPLHVENVEALLSETNIPERTGGQ